MTRLLALLFIAIGSIQCSSDYLVMSTSHQGDYAHVHYRKYWLVEYPKGTFNYVYPLTLKNRLVSLDPYVTDTVVYKEMTRFSYKITEGNLIKTDSLINLDSLSIDSDKFISQIGLIKNVNYSSIERLTCTEKKLDSTICVSDICRPVYCIHFSECPDAISSHPTDFVRYYDKYSLNEIKIKKPGKPPYTRYTYTDTIFFNSKWKQKKFLKMITDSTQYNFGVNCEMYPY